jgi:hypothetical protein
LCGPNSGNSTRVATPNAPNGPAFTCKTDPQQSQPIPGHGTPPPPMFGTQLAHAATAAVPQPSATTSIAALSRAVGHAISSRQLGGHSRHLDLLVGLALLVGATAVGYGFWRTRRV